MIEKSIEINAEEMLSLISKQSFTTKEKLIEILSQLLPYSINKKGVSKEQKERVYNKSLDIAQIYVLQCYPQLKKYSYLPANLTQEQKQEILSEFKKEYNMLTYARSFSLYKISEPAMQNLTSKFVGLTKQSIDYDKNQNDIYFKEELDKKTFIENPNTLNKNLYKEYIITNQNTTEKNLYSQPNNYQEDKHFRLPTEKSKVDKEGNSNKLQLPSLEDKYKLAKIEEDLRKNKIEEDFDKKTERLKQINSRMQQGLYTYEELMSLITSHPYTKRDEIKLAISSLIGIPYLTDKEIKDALSVISTNLQLNYPELYNKLLEIDKQNEIYIKTTGEQNYKLNGLDIKRLKSVSPSITKKEFISFSLPEKAKKPFIENFTQQQLYAKSCYQQSEDNPENLPL